MNTTSLTIVIVLVLAVLAALVTLAALRSARTRRLRTRFGPEYERVAASAPNREKAESELRARERRHAGLDLRPLDAAARDRYAREWAEVQERFVDAPARSIHDADRLVTALMRERGYPAEDVDQQLSDLSVRHGHTLGHYREAHAISTRISGAEAETEEMRQAMVHFREMFGDLLADATRDDVREPDPGAPGRRGPGARPGIAARLRNALHPDAARTAAPREDRP